MKTSPSTLAHLGPLPKTYQALRDQLATTTWISQGTLVCRPLLRKRGRRTIKKGPYYLWTAKHKGKTLCLSLSQAQHRLLAQAIQNNRRLQKLIERMHALTMQTILRQVPGVKKRK
jgi:hypothetical protein